MPSHRGGPRHVAAALAALLLVVATPLPAAAQSLSITTPYPVLAVQPGATASFALSVESDRERRVDLAITQVPEGWTAALRGGGYEIGAVFAGPGDSPEVALDVNVPDGAEAGAAGVTVTASGGGASASLTVEVNVTSEAAGTVELATDFPSASGFGDEAFEFSLELSNQTPQPLTFGLGASGPEGWQVTVRPAGQTTAASVTVEARATQRLTVTATPPAETEAGSYPIVVEATAGEQQARAELTVEITGRVSMTFGTEDQRLSTTANAGATREVTVVVFNEGTAPLTAVRLTATAPTEWEVTFEPETIEQVAPGSSATAIARITPSGNAIAGDYVVTMRASAEEAADSIELRVTVETSVLWGLVGVILIVAALGSLGWVYRRYGRR